MKKEKQKKYIHKILDLKYESIIIIVSMIFIFLAFFFTSSYQASKDLQRTIIYGKHNGAVLNVDRQDYQNIKNHIKIEEIGLAGKIGEIEIIDGEDITIAGELGIADQAFFDLESFEWIDGRLPENDHEVIVETTFLDNMHMSYAIDSEIDLTVAENGINTEKTYTIVGIIRPISTNWLNTDIPGVLTIGSEEEIFQHERNCYFFSSYDSEEEMSELKDLLSYQNEELIYNTSSYPEKQIETDTIYEYGIISYLFILLFVFGYMLILWKDQIRLKQRINVLKNYGCENKTISFIVIKRIIHNWIKGVTASTFLTAVIYVIGIFVTRNEQAYTVNADPLMLCAISIVILIVMIVMNMIIILPNLKAKSTEENKQIVQKHKTDNNSFTYKKLCRIESLQQRKHIWTTCILSVVGVSVITACIYNASRVQFSFDIQTELNPGYTWSSSYDGLTTEQVNTVKNVYGIEDVIVYNLFSNIVTLKDSSGVNDEYIHLITQGNDEMSLSIYTFPENSSIYDTYIKDKDYEEEWKKGEMVLLMMYDITESDDELMPYDVVNTTQKENIESSKILQFKDEDAHPITICIDDNEQNFTNVEIISKLSDEWQKREDVIADSSIIVSPELFSQMTGMKMHKWNTVEAFVNADADETTAIQLSNITNKQTIDFQDNSQQVDEIYRNYYSTIITIVGIMIFAFVFSLILIVQDQKTYFEAIQSKIKLFSELGLDQKNIRKLYFKPAPHILTLILIVAHVGELLLMGSTGINASRVSDLYVRLISTYQNNFDYFPWVLDILLSGIYLLVIYLSFQNMPNEKDRT